MNNGASFSEDRTYRYALWRIWGDPAEPNLVVIGLNPSTADESENDPTIRRCIGFAKREGAGGLVMLNLFGLRATDPKVMKAHPEPVGVGNDEAIRHYCDGRNAVIAAWGAHGSHRGRDESVLGLLRPATKVYCFGQTKGGFPKHPLYLKSDTVFEAFRNVRSPA